MPSSTSGGLPIPLDSDPMSDMAKWVRDLAGAIDQPATGWTAVTFQNSWVNFGGTTQAVQYKRVGERVYVRGVGKTGASATVMFTLPAGYRPPADLRFAIDGNVAYAVCDVASSGTVTVTGTGVPTRCSLALSFERA